MVSSGGAAAAAAAAPVLHDEGEAVASGDAVSSVGPCAPLPPEAFPLDASYGTVAWWKEHFDGFGFSEEQYAVLEAATWGVAPKEIRRVIKRRAKAAAATCASPSKTSQPSE
jgi:hypothetical protein